MQKFANAQAIVAALQSNNLEGGYIDAAQITPSARRLVHLNAARLGLAVRFGRGADVLPVSIAPAKRLIETVQREQTPLGLKITATLEDACDLKALYALMQDSAETTSFVVWSANPELLTRVRNSTAKMGFLFTRLEGRGHEGGAVMLQRAQAGRIEKPCPIAERIAALEPESGQFIELAELRCSIARVYQIARRLGILVRVCKGLVSRKSNQLSSNLSSNV